ncbi:MAG: polysaccharide deacetylase family protein [Burkholderiales bacterium]|nr:polysaccharide deacetylase family protein [Burkholderiales bacterium]
MSEAQRIPVLMYHRIDTPRNAWEARYAVSPRRFAAHMQALHRSGYRAVPIAALIGWLEGRGSLPQGAIAITFDDGFLSVYEHALPVLETLAWPFTVFLVSDRIGGTDTWSVNQNPSGRTYPLLGIDHIRAMQRLGVDFQSHTRTHPSLPRLNETALVEELLGSRMALGELLGREVYYLAYPFGHVDDRVEAAARAAGYRAAFSTFSGFNRRKINPFRIRRIDVFGTDSARRLLRKVALGSNEGGLDAQLRYYWGRIKGRMSA